MHNKMLKISTLALIACLSAALLSGCGTDFSKVPVVKTESPLITTATQAATTEADDEDTDSSKDSNGFTTGSTAKPQSGSKLGMAIAKTANSQVGAPYKSGGNGEEGFDTGSFVKYCYAENDVTVSRSVSGQASFGKSVDENDIEAGDIVVISASVGGEASVTGIYIGDYQFVACTSKGVQTLSLTSTYWSQRYIDARRQG